MPDVQIEKVQEVRKDLVGYLSGNMAEYFANIPDEYLGKSDIQLEVGFATKPTHIDWSLRRKLWALFEDAKGGKIPAINPVDVYEGICSRQHFFVTIKNPLRLAWMSITPTSYNDMMDRGLYVGLVKIIDYVQDSPINEKNFGNFIKLIEQLSNRVIGPVTQRLETKNLSVNITQSDELSNPESVNKKLEDLKRRLLQAPETVDVDAE